MLLVPLQQHCPLTQHQRPRPSVHIPHSLPLHRPRNQVLVLFSVGPRTTHIITLLSSTTLTLSSTQRRGLFVPISLPRPSPPISLPTFITASAPHYVANRFQPPPIIITCACYTQTRRLSQSSAKTCCDSWWFLFLPGQSSFILTRASWTTQTFVLCAASSTCLQETPPSMLSSPKQTRHPPSPRIRRLHC